MKDAAQDMAQDVTQDVAEDVPGAAEDEPSSVSGGKITITAVACPQLPPSPRPQNFPHQRFLYRRALFELSKPFVGAAGPVAVAVDTSRAGT